MENKYSNLQIYLSQSETEVEPYIPLNNDNNILREDNTSLNDQDFRFQLPNPKHFQTSEDSDMGGNPIPQGNSKSNLNQSITSHSIKNPHLIYSKHQNISQKKKKQLKQKQNTDAPLINPNNPSLNELKQQIFKLCDDNITLQEENSLLCLEKGKDLKNKRK